MTVLLVEQNVVASLKLANRAYVLENGRIAMSGTGAELLNDDRVRQAYLGIETAGHHALLPVEGTGKDGARTLDSGRWRPAAGRPPAHRPRRGCASCR